MTKKNASQRKVWRTLAASTILGCAATFAVFAGPAHLASRVSGWGQGSAGFDLERARDRLDFVASWVLERVEATPEQEHAVESRLFEAMDELSGLGLSHQGRRDLVREILTAEDVDRVALEEARRDAMEHADLASRVLVEAVADIAEELTPEQRRELAELAESFHGRRGFHGPRG